MFDCKDCPIEQSDINVICDCKTDCLLLEKWLKEHDKKVRADVIEFISDNLIYPLLDEYDRGLWEHISHIELAEEWIKVLNDNPYPKVKNHNEARKKDLKKWIAKQLKEQADG